MTKLKTLKILKRLKRLKNKKKQEKQEKVFRHINQKEDELFVNQIEIKKDIPKIHKKKLLKILI